MYGISFLSAISSNNTAFRCPIDDTPKKYQDQCPHTGFSIPDRSTEEFDNAALHSSTYYVHEHNSLDRCEHHNGCNFVRELSGSWALKLKPSTGYVLRRDKVFPINLNGQGYLNIETVMTSRDKEEEQVNQILHNCLQLFKRGIPQL